MTKTTDEKVNKNTSDVELVKYRVTVLENSMKDFVGKWDKRWDEHIENEQELWGEIRKKLYEQNTKTEVFFAEISPIKKIVLSIIGVVLITIVQAVLIATFSQSINI